MCSDFQSGVDGYTTDWKNLGHGDPCTSSNWYRIITRDTKQIIQIAIRRNTLCVDPDPPMTEPPCDAPSEIQSRAWTSQSSNDITRDKLPWHDWQTTGDLSKNFDNTAGFGGFVSSLPVTLSSFSSSKRGGGLLLDWSTSTETINMGFNVYAYVDGEKVILNDLLIPSKAPNSVVPQYYEEAGTGRRA